MRRHTWLLLALAVGGATCSRPSPRAIPERDDDSVHSLFDLAHVDAVVPIDPTLSIRLASVMSAVEDPTDRSILVLDSAGSRHLYRLDRRGTAIGEYDPHNPAESVPSKPRDFAVLGSGDIVVLDMGSGLEKLSRTGQLLRTKHLDYTGYNIVAHGNRVYVRAGYEQQAGPHDVFMYDANLREVGSFHTVDPRISQYAFIPYRSLTTNTDGIFVSDEYQLGLEQYSFDGSLLTRYDIGAPDDTTEYWQHRPLTEGDRSKIRDNTHRFFMIQGFGQKLLAYERSDARNINLIQILTPRTPSLVRFPRLHLLPINSSVARQDPVFDRVVGTYQHGLIMLLEDVARVHNLLAILPTLPIASFSETDNPVLVFVAFERQLGRQTNDDQPK